jgi:hypothetical protein
VVSRSAVRVCPLAEPRASAFALGMVVPLPENEVRRLRATEVWGFLTFIVTGKLGHERVLRPTGRDGQVLAARAWRDPRLRRFDRHVSVIAAAPLHIP